MSQTKSADVAPFAFNAIQTMLVFTQKEVLSLMQCLTMRSEVLTTRIPYCLLAS